MVRLDSVPIGAFFAFLDNIGIVLFRVAMDGLSFENWIPAGRGDGRYEFKGVVCDAEDIVKDVLIIPSHMYVLNSRKTVCTMKSSVVEYFLQHNPSLDSEIAAYLRDVDSFYGSESSQASRTHSVSAKTTRNSDTKRSASNEQQQNQTNLSRPDAFDISDQSSSSTELKKSNKKADNSGTKTVAASHPPMSEGSVDVKTACAANNKSLNRNNTNNGTTSNSSNGIPKLGWVGNDLSTLDVGAIFIHPSKDNSIELSKISFVESGASFVLVTQFESVGNNTYKCVDNSELLEVNAQHVLLSKSAYSRSGKNVKVSMPLSQIWSTVASTIATTSDLSTRTSSPSRKLSAKVSNTETRTTANNNNNNNYSIANSQHSNSVNRSMHNNNDDEDDSNEDDDNIFDHDEEDNSDNSRNVKQNPRKSEANSKLIVEERNVPNHKLININSTKKTKSKTQWQSPLRLSNSPSKLAGVNDSSSNIRNSIKNAEIEDDRDVSGCGADNIVNSNLLDSMIGKIYGDKSATDTSTLLPSLQAPDLNESHADSNQFRRSFRKRKFIDEAAEFDFDDEISSSPPTPSVTFVEIAASRSSSSDQDGSRSSPNSRNNNTNNGRSVSSSTNNNISTSGNNQKSGHHSHSNKQNHLDKKYIGLLHGKSVYKNGYIGVEQIYDRYKPFLTMGDGKPVMLRGLYDSSVEAAIARDYFAVQLHKYGTETNFANLNGIASKAFPPLYDVRILTRQHSDSESHSNSNSSSSNSANKRSDGGLHRPSDNCNVTDAPLLDTTTIPATKGGHYLKQFFHSSFAKIIQTYAPSATTQSTANNNFKCNTGVAVDRNRNFNFIGPIVTFDSSNV